MIRRGSTGISATFGYLCLSFVTWPAEALGRRRPGVQILLPQRPLRQTEHRAPALGADVLIVPAARQLVAKAEFLLDGAEVAHHQLRGIGLPAAPARRLVPARARVLVEADTELRRPLEHVEQLAERQPEQRDDHRRGMENREELVGIAPHPRIADRPHQTRDADREE